LVHIRLDINWTKTHFMVVSSNNKILLPDFIKIENHDITLVYEFELLGFNVDNKLNFLITHQLLDKESKS
jgi:hypothetical protein